jgi:aspartyl-tRNA(Asn)/glutamyl-tRNA(Gln) amidotransferase subunit B
LNEKAILMSYIVARALHCTLSESAVFERKNYFYPDMPKNYQISQYSSPLGRDGYLDVEFRKKKKRIRIHEVHLEEDAGKMIHAGDMSLLDYNRAGTPLLEIVTEPDMEIGEEAEVLLQNFRKMVRYLGVCDGNMEEGSMRCDANVSINLRGKGLGRKVEIKNLNSSRFVKMALNFEIARQEEILERGGTVVQETRLWNENRDLTEPMRTKESAHDYRYFPEPDLPPFRPDGAFLKKVDSSLVELPEERKERFLRQYLLSENSAEFVIGEKSTADYFEEAVALGADPQTVAAWLQSDVQKVLNRTGRNLAAGPLTPKRLAELLKLIADRRIHGKIAKQVLDVLFEEDKDPSAIIKEKKWEQITDPAELGKVIDRVLAAHAHIVQAVKNGDTKPMGFLVGLIMKETGGMAEPQALQTLLKERLSLSFVQVLFFGGAITGTRDDRGVVTPGDEETLKRLLAESAAGGVEVRREDLKIGGFLSEEVTPGDWAVLLSAVDAVLRSGNASGIVITHGTDTLSYTASLVHWFFSAAKIPIVLTAAALPPGADSDASENLKAAVRRAASGRPGVTVLFGGKEYSPLNLKFQRVAPMEFANWNMRDPLFSGKSILPSGFVYEELKERLEKAVGGIFVTKVFPGMRGDMLISLMKAGVKYFILELYDTGTASLREGPFSLKKAFAYGKETGVRFFCTSQQEGLVDFSEYVTAHELWKEGAVPMGGLSTESAYTRLIAAALSAETDEELVRLMEV